LNQASDKLLGRLAEEVAGGLEAHHLIDSQPTERLNTLRQRRQSRGGFRRSESCDWVWIKGQGHDPCRVGLCIRDLSGLLNQGGVTYVHAVEVADHDHAAGLFHAKGEA
jgi:hypothetical protein